MLGFFTKDWSVPPIGNYPNGKLFLVLSLVL